MFKVGITGGIGSGKSTVAKMFAEHGVAVFYSDNYVKELYTRKPIQNLVNRVLEEEIFSDAGFNRARMIEIVFNNDEKRNQLNNVMLPFVMVGFDEFCKANKDAIYVMFESAIIYDLDMQDHFDYMVLVLADFETRIARTMVRDKVDRESVLERIRVQKNPRPVKNCFLVFNGDIKQTEYDVLTVHDSLVSIMQNKKGN